jgi:hypothetical protein
VRVVGVTGQARVEDALDAGVAFQESRDPERALVVLAHAHGECLEAANQQVRAVRVGHPAEDSARVTQPVHQRLRAAHHSRKHVVVTGEVLGARVGDQIGAVRERPAQHRRRQRRIDQKLDARKAPLDLHHAREVDHA